MSPIPENSDPTVTPRFHEEDVKLITSFNDIFVCVALLLTMVSIGGLLSSVSPMLISPMVAIFVFAASEIFVRRKKMATPSLLLLAAFVISVSYCFFLIGATGFALIGFDVKGPISGLRQFGSSENLALSMLCAFFGGILASYAYWRRFRVPASISLIFVSTSQFLVVLLAIALPSSGAFHSGISFIFGLVGFAFALSWDFSDPERKTRRSDVAFWLHLAAAPMIVRSLFGMIGILTVRPSATSVVIALAFYLVMGVIALVIDRRALLISALVYILYALSSVFSHGGSMTLSLSLTGLIIGSALLSLSVWWRPLRAPFVRLVPDKFRTKLPPI